MQNLILIPILAMLGIGLIYQQDVFALQEEVADEFGEDYIRFYYEIEDDITYYTDEFEEDDITYDTDEFEENYVSGGRCTSITLTNDPSVYPRCTLIDTTPPRLGRVFVTPSDQLCVQAHDNTAVVNVTYNGELVPKWPGSYGFFCTDNEFPPAIRIVVEDFAGNIVETVATNRQKLLETPNETIFSAKRSLSLNPHHGVEGVNLYAKLPIEQLRIATDGFMFNELRLSDYAMQELLSNKTLVVEYTGQYANTEYGKERHGQIHFFASNIGRLATFDVDVNDDIIVQAHKEKQGHKPYDLDVQDMQVLDRINLNTWQQVELEKVFSSTAELTIYQKNILRKLLKSD